MHLRSISLTIQSKINSHFCYADAGCNHALLTTNLRLQKILCVVNSVWADGASATYAPAAAQYFWSPQAKCLGEFTFKLYCKNVFRQQCMLLPRIRYEHGKYRDIHFPLCYTHVCCAITQKSKMILCKFNGLPGNSEMQLSTTIDHSMGVITYFNQKYHITMMTESHYTNV